MSSAGRANLTKLWTGIKDWGHLTVVIGLMLRESVVVTDHLNQYSHWLGILAGIMFFGMAGYCFGLLHKRLNKWQRSLVFLCAGAAIVFFIGNAGTAQAQFLQNAEDFFTQGADTFGLGESVTLLVTLIFWIIRGAFVIGVAIALLPAIQAAREGEEWRSLAKTPMLVVGIVLAGSTSVDFLVGEGGG
jgi:hypothetical protein